MTKNEISKKLDKALDGSKTIKVFKIKRWTSVANSTMFEKIPGWETEKRLYLTKKEALAKVAKDREFHKEFGTSPFKVKIFSKVMDGNQIEIRRI